MEDLESDEEVEEVEGLLKTPRKKRPSAGTPESTPSAPKKKRVKFSKGVADSTYVEVSDFPPASAQGDVADIPPAAAQGGADDIPPATAQGAGSELGSIPAPVHAQDIELEAAKRKAAEVLRASLARKFARGEDLETLGLSDLKSKPKKVMLTDYLSSPKKTSAGKYSSLWVVMY